MSKADDTDVREWLNIPDDATEKEAFAIMVDRQVRMKIETTRLNLAVRRIRNRILRREARATERMRRRLSY